MSTQITVHNPQQAEQAIRRQLWPWIKSMLAAGHKLDIVARAAKRSSAQNALMWSCLKDLSDQVTWFGKKLTKEGWKDFITGHLDGQDLVPNMDGTGFISIQRGKSTSQMTIKEMTAVIDLCHAFGAERGVKWSKTSIGHDEIDPETGEVLMREST